MNYYEILEVSTNASKEVIKNAYRALIKKYHPDSYTGNKQYAENKLKEINEAYEVLSDDNKRLLYDYDNGFKINPNAPKEEDVNTYNNKNEDSNIQEKNSEKDKVKTNEKEDIDFKDKIIEIFKNRRNIVICVAALFLVAFVFGFIISSPNDNKEEEQEKKVTQKVTVNEDKDDDKPNTTVDKDYNSDYNTYNNYNNYNNHKENNNKYQDVPSNNVDDKVEQNDENNNNSNIDISENNNQGIS